MIGTTVGHFKILEKIASGGMGVVYKAEDITLNRIVALKSLLPTAINDPEEMGRLIHEAKTASILDHHNICTIHEVLQTGEGQVFIAMAYYQGETVAHKLRYGPLPPAQALPIALDVASGLAKAHRHGIIHRDIKPGNIVVTIDGIAKILDFGIAKLVSSAAGAGTTIGTLAYMSPEQLRGESVDQRADIWAWGVVLFEMLTGRTPFQFDDRCDLKDAILCHEVELTGLLQSSLPPGLARIISKSLEKDPASRYLRMDDALRDLQRCWPHEADLHYRPQQASVSAATPSIAVLPFRTLSRDPEDEWFSDGLTEELSDALTHLDGLRVAARTSVFALRTEHTRAEIAATLKVEFLLEGSIRRSGTRLRINIQLINAAEERELWSEHFDRDIQDIFAVQEEIAGTVVEKLKIRLTDPVTPHLVKRSTADVRAYNLYLKGRYQWNRESPEALFKAAETFRQASEADPSFVSPVCGLAECYLVMGAKALLPPGEAWRRAKEAAKKALALNPALADAHGCLGAVLAINDFDWTGAEQQFRNALELDPTSAVTQNWYAIALLGPQGRFDEAIAQLTRGIESEPLSLIYNSTLAWICYLSQQWALAAEQCLKTLEIDPDHVDSLWCLGETRVELGQYEQAIATLTKLYDVSGGVPFVYGAMGHAYAKAANLAEARKILSSMRGREHGIYSSPVCEAWIYANLPGEENRALDCLEKAYTERDFLIRFMHFSPALRPLYSQPRFKNLLRRMNLQFLATGSLDETITLPVSA